MWGLIWLLILFRISRRKKRKKFLMNWLKRKTLAKTLKWKMKIPVSFIDTIRKQCVTNSAHYHRGRLEETLKRRFAKKRTPWRSSSTKPGSTNLFHFKLFSAICNENFPFIGIKTHIEIYTNRIKTTPISNIRFFFHSSFYCRVLWYHDWSNQFF